MYTHVSTDGWKQYKGGGIETDRLTDRGVSAEERKQRKGGRGRNRMEEGEELAGLCALCETDPIGETDV